MQRELIDQDIVQQKPQKIIGHHDLPNVQSVYYKGLFGMILCTIAGSILGLVLVKLCFDHGKVATDLYRQNPDLYTEDSVSKLKRGKAMAYTGIAISIAEVLAFMAYTA